LWIIGCHATAVRSEEFEATINPTGYHGKSSR